MHAEKSGYVSETVQDYSDIVSDDKWNSKNFNDLFQALSDTNFSYTVISSLYNFTWMKMYAFFSVFICVSVCVWPDGLTVWASDS